MKLKYLAVRIFAACRGAMPHTGLSIFMLASIVALCVPSARADIVPFTGGLEAQTAWRVAVGNSYAFEDFDTFATNTLITSLPALGLTLEELAAGGQPGIYEHAIDNTPSGPKQLANFPGNPPINYLEYRRGDLVMNVDAGVDLYAFGFWNGDPQGNAALRIYNRAGDLIGTVTAAINTGNPTIGLSSSFAGFTSTEAVGRLEFEGDTGDGWNHYDDFHASFATPSSVPEPGTFGLMLTAVGGLYLARRRNTGGNRSSSRPA